MIQAMKAMNDIVELRATADNLAWRKDMVAADFNQVFPAACVALMLTSAAGAAGFVWILFRLAGRKPASGAPAPGDRAL